MNRIKANFCSRTQIEQCNICHHDLNKDHLFKCTREGRTFNPINYNHILNGTLLQQIQGIEFLNTMEKEETDQINFNVF